MTGRFSGTGPGWGCRTAAAEKQDSAAQCEESQAGRFGHDVEAPLDAIIHDHRAGAGVVAGQEKLGGPVGYGWPAGLVVEGEVIVVSVAIDGEAAAADRHRSGSGVAINVGFRGRIIK